MQTSTDPHAAPCTIEIAASASLPTRFGEFCIVVFAEPRTGREHVAIVRGHVGDASDVPVRVHSECLTGDALGSLRCDCRDQLVSALELLGTEPRGVLLYLRQEGRGIGLANKIRAYALQEEGVDTMDANLQLGFGADERDYVVAADMLHALGVRSVRLLTNNPDKVAQLRHHGVDVERVAHEVIPSEHNRAYLECKAQRFGHLLSQIVGPTSPRPSIV